MVGGVAVRVEADGRGERRDEVLHRTRASLDDGTCCPLLVVNVSPGGMMARCERAFAIGERLGVELPGAGSVIAEVRWSLGGRIGCRFVVALGPGVYDGVLEAMR